MSLRSIQILTVHFVLTLVACGPEISRVERAPVSESGGSIDLIEGAFLASTGLADLRSSAAEVAENPSLWNPQPVVPGSGWWFVGRGWQPTSDSASLELRRRPGAESVLVLEFDHAGGTPTDSYRLEVRLNGTLLDTLATAPGRNRFRLLPPPGLVAAVNDLGLRISPAPEAVEGRWPLSVIRVGFLGGSGSGTYLVPAEIPTGAETLEIELTGTDGGLGSARLFALAEEPEPIDLGTFPIGIESRQVEAVSIVALAGRRVVLGLEVASGAASARLSLARIRLSPAGQSSNPAGESPGHREPARQAASRPDVLLIILDAARGDRFPGWGYPRPVLPTLEELARTALSFRHTFAECPTTSCSIPALITGRSFLPGGQVGGGQQLSDDVQTLAEELRAGGYSTVGFSATPNNSASRNLDQGFDRFDELWGKDSPHHGPFAMSRLAARVIAEQPPAVPLYLQLHYLPPHQPYDPGPEHDRFTDPGYDGPIHPRMSLKPYSLGMEPLAGRDLEHLIGLYDGNLLRADAAVADVLEALRAAGRFDNTVIVITSDHGEAFMEHGRQGHNTTLFDEMLHIPLMIRLPGGRVPAVDTDRLASALDVVATVLGRAGIAPRDRLDGIDLIDSPADPLRPRTLFFRTSHPAQPMLAARTMRWKMIAWPQHRVQMLFDLALDPGEGVNLVGEAPERYAGMGLAVRTHLETHAQQVGDSEEIRLTTEEREALRALGYLD